MYVYVVCKYWQEDWLVLDVFQTREDADEYVKYAKDVLQDTYLYSVYKRSVFTPSDRKYIIP